MNANHTLQFLSFHKLFLQVLGIALFHASRGKLHESAGCQVDHPVRVGVQVPTRRRIGKDASENLLFSSSTQRIRMMPFTE